MLRSASKTLALLALALPALAGPLDPPAGPITSTQKPLSEIEPRTAVNATNTPSNAVAHFVISKPGSYYLTGNLKVAKPIGVQIVSPDVTLDLNGFAIILEGVNASTAVSGYSDGQNTYPHIVVRNGVVSGAFTESGIDVDGSGCVVEDVVVSGTKGAGISISYNSRITRCTADACETGFSLGAGSSLVDSNATNCSQYGASVGDALVRGCTFAFNNAGLYCYAGADIRDNLFRYNAQLSGAGIYLNGVGARVENNSVIGSWNGILIGASATDNLVIRNTIRKGGGISSITMAGQVANSFPNNHVAAILADPASPFASTNASANIQY